MQNGWSSVITWCLVFAGWYAVHRATLSRDRRKEKREISVRLCTDIVSLQSDAIDFHTGDHCDARKSTDLAQQVEHVLLQLEKSPLAELEIPYARRVKLRQSITRRNIDPSDFASQPPDSPIVLEIRNAVTDMVFAVEDAREDKWK